MSEDIYWVCVFTVDPNKFVDFQKVVAPLVAATRAEPGSMAYEYSVSADNSTVHIVERYRNSDAVISHVTKVFSQFAEPFTALANVSSFNVYGNPNAEARNILDGFGAVYFSRFDGFTK
jgi:quinol monooxygenase YgiN